MEEELHFTFPAAKFFLDYPGPHGEQIAMEFPILESHDFLMTLHELCPEEQDIKVREYAEAHGGRDIPTSVLMYLPNAIVAAFREYKKKLPEQLTLQPSTESTPSLLEEIKRRSSEFTSPESKPTEELKPMPPEASSTPNASTT